MALAATSTGVRLSHVVHEIAWEPGAVEVHFSQPGNHTSSVAARAAIITVPLGVLQQTTGPGAITFTPDVTDARQASNQLAMGVVGRTTLLFREPFWESHTMRRRTGGRSLARLSFLHSSDDDVPIWWTAAPVRATTLVGWVGGTKAARLIARGPDEVQARAIAAVGRLFGMRRQRVQTLVEQSWYHDWHADPFSAAPTATHSWAEAPRRSVSRARSLTRCSSRARQPTAKAEPARCTARWARDIEPPRPCCA